MEARSLLSTGNRRQRRTAQTRESLFRAALKLFAERGFANTTVEDITNAADVGKGTFFNYFPTKEHILAQLAAIQIGKVSQAAEAVESGANTQVAFRALIRALAEEPMRTPNLSRSLLMGLLSSDAAREVITPRFAQGRDVLTRILTMGQQRGEVRRDLYPSEMALLFQQQLFGAIIMWSIHETLDLGRMLHVTVEIYLQGINVSTETARRKRPSSRSRKETV